MNKHAQYSNGKVVWGSNGPVTQAQTRQENGPSMSSACLWGFIALIALIVVLYLSTTTGFVVPMF